MTRLTTHTQKCTHRQIPVEAKAELEEQGVRKQRGQEGVGRRGQPRRGAPAAEGPEVEQKGVVAGGDLCFWGWLGVLLFYFLVV